ncbi:putative NACHT and Ankyrin domain protein [Paramyrothecium foliicola]|nr:putative NACHT and Ankyrin domain protein [Paramyrothecium foliicola]
MDRIEGSALPHRKHDRHFDFTEDAAIAPKRPKANGSDAGQSAVACENRQRKLRHEHYTIGWISALPIEMAAAKATLMCWGISESTQYNRNITQEHPLTGADADHTVNKPRRRMLLDALKYQEMDTRHNTIKAAHRKTCQWLLEQPEFAAWWDSSKRSEHHGFLWITGKPGAGKSTIMKYAFESTKKKRQKEAATLSFFFNRRGDVIEWSIAGMYRSLMSQLLQRYADMQSVLDDPKYDSWATDSGNSWNIETLRDLFSSAIDKLGSRSLICFIDALDECDQRDIWEMVEHFEALGAQAVENHTNLFICFASRHYPHIDVSHRIKLILEHQPGHKLDLELYVHGKLRADAGPIADEVKATIIKKSDGVFMWVVLVVDILNEELRDGRIFAVKKRLQELPPGLSDLFQDMLTRDKKNLKDLLLSIQWISYAQRPLKCSEFYLAVVAGLDPEAESLGGWDDHRITTNVIRKFVLSSSKGLAEITKSDEPTVQFIHESVRDFLVTDNGINKLWLEHSSHFESFSHEQLKTCCNNYIKYLISVGVLSQVSESDKKSHERRQQRSNVTESFPFLEYATTNLFFHAERADERFSQKEFLKELRFQDWFALRKASSASREIRRLRHPTLAHELAGQHCLRLLRVMVQQDGKPDTTAVIYLIFDAIAKGHRGVVENLLQYWTSSAETKRIAAEFDYTTSLTENRYQKVLHWAAAEGYASFLRLVLATGEFDVNQRDKDEHTPIHYAVDNGHLEVVRVLLTQEDIDPAAKTRDHYSSPFLRAIIGGHEDVALLLLDSGRLYLDPKDKVICWAAKYGHLRLVAQLLRRWPDRLNEIGVSGTTKEGVDPNLANSRGRTPLSVAAAYNQTEMIELLLSQSGINPNLTDDESRTPLSVAIQYNQTEAIRLLLGQSGVDPNLANNRGRTPLSIAIRIGHMEAIELLLDKEGIELNRIDDEGDTSLSLAVKTGQTEVVKRLLTHFCIPKWNLQKALLLGCKYGDLEIVRLLLKCGDILKNPQDYGGRTPMVVATTYNHLEIVQLLIDTNDCSLNQHNGLSYPPLVLAAENNFTSIVELLLAHDEVDPNCQDQDGHTAFWWGTKNRSRIVLRSLLDHDKFDQDSIGYDGITPSGVLQGPLFYL